MGCQRKIVKEIIKKKADYVISLKGNQETLHEEVKEYFVDLEKEKLANKKSENAKVGYVKTLDKGHGRVESREYYYSTDTNWMEEQKKDWAGLNGIGMVHRRVTKKDIVTEEIQYYIGSVNNVETFAKAVRGHWGIESVHWSLDVTFKDDANKSRKECTPQNLAVARRIALNMVRNKKELYPKLSANLKRLTASLNEEYRSHVFDLNFKK